MKTTSTKIYYKGIVRITKTSTVITIVVGVVRSIKTMVSMVVNHLGIAGAVRATTAVVDRV